MPKKLKFDEEYVIKRANEGASANQIAKELKCCQPTIAKFFKEKNLKMRCVKQFEGELPAEEIIYKYKVLKMSPEQLRKKYNCSCNPIYSIIKNHNIVVNKQRDYSGKLKDENFFENIDTEEKAYILGWIASDGCLTADRFRLCLADEDMVKRIAKIIGWEGKIEHNPPSMGKFPDGKMLMRKETWKFSIYSKKLVADCTKHGVGPNKSKELSLPNISENLMKHFIRGFFDGDGCILVDNRKGNLDNGWVKGYPRYKVIGIKEILAGIKEFFIKKCNVSKKVNLQDCKTKYNVSLFILEYVGFSALSIRDYLYKDATIYLQRKYDKFHSIIIPNFSGYLVKQYAKKYNFSKRSIQRWITDSVLPHTIENGFRVIPFEDGDSFAKSKQIDISKLIRMSDSKQYNKTELAQIFNISKTKLTKILRDNIRNFGLTGDSPMEINYNLNI